MSVQASFKKLQKKNIIAWSAGRAFIAETAVNHQIIDKVLATYFRDHPEVIKQ